MEEPGGNEYAVTIAEAARRLSVSRDTVYRLIYAGELETIHIGRASRVLVASIIAYLRRQAERERDQIAPYVRIREQIASGG